jgi:hypothetical protein
MESKKIYDAWKDPEKAQKMSSIRASYLKLFRSGGLLKSRYQNSQIANRKTQKTHFTFRHVIFKQL